MGIIHSNLLFNISKNIIVEKARERRLEIYNYIKNNPNCTIREINRDINMVYNKIRGTIENLLRNNLIKITGKEGNRNKYMIISTK